jgi:hypothetical protein
MAARAELSDAPTTLLRFGLIYFQTRIHAVEKGCSALSASRTSPRDDSVGLTRLRPAMILPTCPAAPSLLRLKAPRGSVIGDNFGPLKLAYSKL